MTSGAPVKVVECVVTCGRRRLPEATRSAMFCKRSRTESAETGGHSSSGDRRKQAHDEGFNHNTRVSSCQTTCQLAPRRPASPMRIVLEKCGALEDLPDARQLLEGSSRNTGFLWLSGSSAHPRGELSGDRSNFNLLFPSHAWPLAKPEPGEKPAATKLTPTNLSY